MKTNRILIVSLAFAILLAAVSIPQAQVTPSKYNGTGVSPINARVMVFSTAKVISSANKYYFKSMNGSTHVLKLDESTAGRITLNTLTDDDFYLGSNSTDGLILSDTSPNIQAIWPNGNSMFLGDASGISRITLRNSGGWQVGTTDGTGYSFRVNTSTADSHLDITDRSIRMNAGTMSNSAKRGFLTSASGGADGGFYIGGSGGAGDIAAGTINGATFEIVTTDAVRVAFNPGNGGSVDHKDEPGNTMWQEIDDGTGGHFAMAGTVKSTNLNADLLDGLDSTAFVAGAGTLTTCSASFNFPPFLSGTLSQVSTAKTCTGVVQGDDCSAGLDADPSAEAVQFTCEVTTANAIKIIATQIDIAGTADPANHTFTIRSVH